eukprot:6196538-Pleurochrysis_carterae.AAC.1
MPSHALGGSAERVAELSDLLDFERDQAERARSDLEAEIERRCKLEEQRAELDAMLVAEKKRSSEVQASEAAAQAALEELTTQERCDDALPLSPLRARSI